MIDRFSDIQSSLQGLHEASMAQSVNNWQEEIFLIPVALITL